MLSIDRTNVPKRACTKSVIMRRENDPLSLLLVIAGWYIYVSSIPLMAIPSERQKNRHRPISEIYDSRELSSVAKSRRIKAKWGREAGKRAGCGREKKKEKRPR